MVACAGDTVVLAVYSILFCKPLRRERRFLRDLRKRTSTQKLDENLSPMEDSVAKTTLSLHH